LEQAIEYLTSQEWPRRGAALPVRLSIWLQSNQQLDFRWRLENHRHKVMRLVLTFKRSSPSMVFWAMVPYELWTPKMKEAVAKLRAALGTNEQIVFRLRRPLYGLPISGRLWEQHLSASLTGDGWKPLEGYSQAWTRTDAAGNVALLTAYVDDLMLSGKDHGKWWPSIRALIDVSEPERLSKLLGIQFIFRDLKTHWEVEMNMKDYMKECVKRYVATAGAPPMKPRAMAPFHTFSVGDYTDKSMQSEGIFRESAARLLMSALYACRMVRPDLSYAVCSAAGFLHGWTVMADKRLTAIFSYINNTAEYSMKYRLKKGSLDTLRLLCFADADLGGSDETARSTSGAAIFLSDGCGGDLLVAHWSKRQHSTSTSTAESELVSMNVMVKDGMLPLQQLMTEVLSRVFKAYAFEDNEACLRIILAGYSLALRHVKKHHKLSLSALHETFQADDNDIFHVGSKKQRADGLTKAMSGVEIVPARRMLGVYKPGEDMYSCELSSQEW